MCVYMLAAPVCMQRMHGTTAVTAHESVHLDYARAWPPSLSSLHIGWIGPSHPSHPPGSVRMTGCLCICDLFLACRRLHRRLVPRLFLEVYVICSLYVGYCINALIPGCSWVFVDVRQLVFPCDWVCNCHVCMMTFGAQI